MDVSTPTLTVKAALTLRAAQYPIGICALPYEQWQDSDNLVARLNLPNMAWPKSRKVDIYANAICMLTRFLTKRFGLLEEVTQERLQRAEVEQLEAWSDRVLDARSIDEVFSLFVRCAFGLT